MKRFCVQCGNELLERAKFCTKCGSTVAAPAAPAAEPAVTPAAAPERPEFPPVLPPQSAGTTSTSGKGFLPGVVIGLGLALLVGVGVWRVAFAPQSGEAGGKQVPPPSAASALPAVPSPSTEHTAAPPDQVAVAPSAGLKLGGSYLLPTDTQYISSVDLERFDRPTIVLIRNEIFARYGYNFKDERIRTYFEEQDWYVPVPGLDVSTFDTADFNDYEKTNIATIISYEKDMGWRS